jgi:hypothetical protein
LIVVVILAFTVAVASPESIAEAELLQTCGAFCCFADRWPAGLPVFENFEQASTVGLLQQT